MIRLKCMVQFEKCCVIRLTLHPDDQDKLLLEQLSKDKQLEYWKTRFAHDLTTLKPKVIDYCKSLKHPCDNYMVEITMPSLTNYAFEVVNTHTTCSLELFDPKTVVIVQCGEHQWEA